MDSSVVTSLSTWGGGQDTETTEARKHRWTDNMQFLVWPVHRTFARQSGRCALVATKVGGSTDPFVNSISMDRWFQRWGQSTSPRVNSWCILGSITSRNWWMLVSTSSGDRWMPESVSSRNLWVNPDRWLMWIANWVENYPHFHNCRLKRKVIHYKASTIGRAQYLIWGPLSYNVTMRARPLEPSICHCSLLPLRGVELT